MQEMERAVRVAESLGVDEAIVISTEVNDFSCMFANNSITASKLLAETEMTVCLSKGKKRVISSTTDVDRISEFVRDVYSILDKIPDTEFSYVQGKQVKYKKNQKRVDQRILASQDRVPEFVNTAINSALREGAERCAGTVYNSFLRTSILTSSGIEGTDERTVLEINIRAFSNSEYSGHGLSCSSSLSNFNPERAGEQAGRDAVLMKDAKLIQDGDYDVILSPTVISNLVNYAGMASSAYSVELGSSFFVNKLGKQVASSNFSMLDHGFIEGCLGGRDFDDEGTKTRTTRIIEQGVLKNYIHNLSTARRWNTESTGNAGLIFPHPWNIEILAGDSSYEEMVRDSRKCVVITSNWYTRFNNYQTGDFSTMPRDGIFYVENGEVKHGVKGIRMSDNMLRLLSSIRTLSKERNWVEWWEVNIPTLAPWVLAEKVRLTRAYG